MRYIKPLVCLTACLYLLTSCGGDPEPIETDLSPAQMAAAIINSQDYEQDFISLRPVRIFTSCSSVPATPSLTATSQTAPSVTWMESRPPKSLFYL